MASQRTAPRLSVRTLSDAAELQTVVAIRRQVFVDEQGVATNVDPDNVDRTAYHALGLVDGQVVAIGRLHLANSEGHIAWLAVLPGYRRLGLGRAIMLHLLAIADVYGARVVLLNAQTHALDFYQRLGFEAVADRFIMGGIEHQMMSRVHPPD